MRDAGVGHTIKVADGIVPLARAVGIAQRVCSFIPAERFPAFEVHASRSVLRTDL